MAEHRFKAGQTVRVASHARVRDLVRGGLLEIIRLMPADDTGIRYRVKDLRTGTERIVEEHDLEAVG